MKKSFSFTFCFCTIFLGTSALAVESNDHLDISPDSRFLAFDGGERGSKNIYIYDLENQDCRLLVDLEGDTYVPTWSPDGESLAFTGSVDDKRLIMIVKASGGEPIEIADAKGTISSIGWSPDGKSIVFARGKEDGTTDILIAGLKTKEQKPLIAFEGSQSQPFWASGLEKYVFVADQTGVLEIYTYDPYTEEILQLTSDGTAKYLPRVSKDGSKITFASLVDGHFDQFIMTSDGAVIKNLTDQPGHDLFGTWALDSKALFFESTRDRGDLGGDKGYDLYRLDFETGEVNRVTYPDSCNN